MILRSPLAWTLLLVAAAGGLFMFDALQRQLIYFPERADETGELRAAGQLGLQPWRDRGGDLFGWRPVSSGDGPRMLVFHGNAGRALDRHYYGAGLAATSAGWDVWLFEYPGYGARPGSPSEAAIKAAATAALEQLLAEDARPIFLTGESLGSGVASYLAGEFPGRVAGVLLVTPFTSLPDVAAHHYPVLPVRQLLHERYDAEAALGDYAGPVAFLLAGRDEVVPTELGQRLHDGYPGPRWLRIEPGAGHNTLPLSPRADWWQPASDFLLGES